VEVQEVRPDAPLNVLLLQFGHAVDEVRALGLRAARAADRTCGPRVGRGRVVVVGFAEAHWFESPSANGRPADPFTAPDRLTLTNVSDEALTRCTVVVEIRGRDESRTHMHYVPAWKAGQTLTASYYAGVVVGKKPLFRFTCTNVRQVKVSVYCEQCRQEGITYDNDAANKEYVFREYVGRARVVADCKRYAGVLESGYRVGVSFDGVPHLPDAKLVVRVKRNGEWQEQTMPAAAWRSGTARTADFEDAGGDVRPSAFEVVLTSSFGDWTLLREWHWENK
jgi:hypothetical protein